MANIRHPYGMSFRPLKTKDVIEVVSPASQADAELVRKGCQLLKSWGLQVREWDLKGSRYLYHSSKDQVRLELFMKALRAPESGALWCARGGYGSHRLLPQLWSKARPISKKLLIGLSDVSSLHLLWNQKWKLPSLHGMVLERLGDPQFSNEQKEITRELLFGECYQLFYDLLPANKQSRQRKTSIEGILIGGNLATLQSHSGTPWSLKLRDRILYLEDVGERGYRLDRMLFQLRMQKNFSDLQAVVLGPFVKGEEPNGSSMVDAALSRFADEAGLPVYRCEVSGHGDKQMPLVFGDLARIKSGCLEWRRNT